MANENVSVRDYIDTKLIPQAKEMVEAGYAYNAFGIMAQAVELVGEMFEGGKEATAKEPDRFKTGVSKVFAKSSNCFPVRSGSEAMPSSVSS